MVFSPHRAELGKRRLRIHYSRSEDPQPPFLSLRTHKISSSSSLCCACSACSCSSSFAFLASCFALVLLLVGRLPDKKLGVFFLLLQADEASPCSTASFSFLLRSSSAAAAAALSRVSTCAGEGNRSPLPAPRLGGSTGGVSSFSLATAASFS